MHRPPLPPHQPLRGPTLSFLDQLFNVAVILLSLLAIGAGVYLLDLALMGDTE